MELYNRDKSNFEEVDEQVIAEGIANGTIEAEEVAIEPFRGKKTVEEIYNELQAQGQEVVMHNGVHCKVVYNTFEAINPINDFKIIYKRR